MVQAAQVQRERSVVRVAQLEKQQSSAPELAAEAAVEEKVVQDLVVVVEREARASASSRPELEHRATARAMATRSAAVQEAAAGRAVLRRATSVDPALQGRSVIVHSIDELIRVAE